MTNINVAAAAGIVKDSRFRDLAALTVLMDHVTFGSFTLHKHTGNKEPVFWYDPETGMSINAVGLTNGGLQHFLDNDLPKIVDIFKGTDCKIRISLAPLKIGDLREMVEMLIACPLLKYIYEIEINAACPNHRGEGGLHPVLARDAKAVEALLKEAQPFKYKKALKIAPDMTKKELEAIVMLCVRNHISTIVSANTRLGNSVINGEKRLSVDKGGIAGTPLLESSLNQLDVLSEIIENHAIEVVRLIGCGGASSKEAVLAYAQKVRTVQIATHLHQFGAGGIRDLLVEVHS